MNWSLLQNSLLVASLTTVAAIALGGVTALALLALEPRWRKLGLAAAVAALAMPPFVAVNCWLHYLGNVGAWRAWLPFDLYSLGGAVWILTLLTWPVATLLLLGAWRQLEPAQLEADPMLTGGALIRALLWPLGRGAAAQAAALVFVLALNNFAVPAILQVKVFPAELWVEFSTNYNYAAAWTLGWPLIVAPMIVLLLLTRRTFNWPQLAGGVSAREFRRQLGRGWIALAGVVTLALVCLSLGLPVWQLASAGRTWTELPGAIGAGKSALVYSVGFAALTATLSVGLGLLPAGRRNACATLAWLPFLVPGVLLGILFIAVFNRPGLAWFFQSSGIVVAALVVRYAGIAWTGAAHAVQSVDRDLVDAARLDGAGRWSLLRHIVGPLALPQFAAAWYLVFLLCLWDVESNVLITPPGVETLALRAFNLLHYGHNAQVNAICLTLLAVALAPLALWAISDFGFRISDFRKRLPAVSSSAMIVLLGGLLAGCAPPARSNSSPLESRLFERAEVIGTRGTGLGQLNKPRSLALDRDDNLYVVDMTGRVQKFSPDGQYLAFWQMPETTLGKAKGMGRDREGNILVIEPHYSRVNHFTTAATLIAQWGVHGTNAGQFGMPRAVAVNSRGEIYVCEYSDSERVQRFSVAQPAPGTFAAEVTLLTAWGRPGTAPGEFNRPEGIAADRQDRVYVADSCNHRIQVFDADGRFLRTYGRPGSGIGELSYPYDICVDADGRQYVCEFGNSRIQVFDANDQLVEIIGGPGGAPGRFANPWAIALDSHGNLYVADAMNHRVQKLVRRKVVAGSQDSNAAGVVPLIGAGRRYTELHSARPVEYFATSLPLVVSGPYSTGNVSPTCSRPDVVTGAVRYPSQPAAECNSAIRQIENLRYEVAARAPDSGLPALRIPRSAPRPR